MPANTKSIAAILFTVATLLSFQFTQCDAVSGSEPLPCSNSTAIYEVNATSKSLSQIAIESFNSSDTMINIHVKLMLYDSVKFNHRTAVSLYGNKNTLLCTANSGIVFESVQTVTIQNLTIKNCGTLWFTSEKWRQDISGLHLVYIGYITLQNITIAESNGSGVNIYKPKYNVTIKESYFIGNKLSPIEGLEVGGNGLKIHIANDANKALLVMIENCTFANNWDDSLNYSYLYGHLHGTGRGGGLQINIRYSSRESVVSIINCNFENNTAFLGAGLSVSLKGDGNTKVRVDIIESNVTGNGCINDNRAILGIGGGALLSFENRGKYDKTLNEINITNVTFAKNCASLGGGTFFFSNRYETSTTGLIEFNNCTWIKNTANLGSAILFTPNIFVRARVGYLPTPNFKNCTFSKNSIKVIRKSYSKNNQNQFGSGTMYSSLFSVKFTTNAVFTSNCGSAITIINGEINFQNSSAVFYNNTAVQGGALSLIGVSALVIGSHKDYTFENNMAYDRGGAIFVQLVDSADIMTSRSCFFRYREQTRYLIPTAEWNSSLVFKNNIANREGHSIFATSFLPCQVVSDLTNERYKVLNIKDVFKEPGIIIKDKLKKNQISTEGIQFKDLDTQMAITPGLPHDLNLNILDELDQPVKMNVAAFTPYQSNFNVSSIISNGLQHKVKLTGRERDNVMLTLQTLGTIQLNSKIEVNLLTCPPGYKLSQFSCKCDVESYIGMTRCENNTAYLTRGFWAAYIPTDDNRMILATSICPVGYCNYNKGHINGKEIRLPSNPDDLDRVICGESRQGILCGTCREGYTAYYHSPQLGCDKEEPVSCKLGWLFYLFTSF